MMHLQKSTVLGLIVASVLFRAGAVQAFPIPTIGAELPNQIKMLQEHINELKKVKDQITNGIEQAKSMGDKMSLDALKGEAMNMAKNGGSMDKNLKGFKVPEMMTKTGYSEDVAKDPEKTKSWITKNMKQEKGSYDPEKQKDCEEMKNQMQGELNTSALSTSLAALKATKDNEEFQKLQEASTNTEDQMQMLGAMNKASMLTAKTMALNTNIAANNAAATASSNFCK